MLCTTASMATTGQQLVLGGGQLVVAQFKLLGRGQPSGNGCCILHRLSTLLSVRSHAPGIMLIKAVTWLLGAPLELEGEELAFGAL